MEGTSGTPHLLTDVRFSVSRKGYDPDEVDNFLERVSAAVAQLQDKLRQAAGQAETAEGRAAEASKSQAVLQARIDALEGELAAARAEGPLPAPTIARNPEEDAEQASKMLLLAQRTADAAIEEANSSARATLADARTRADAMVGDAEHQAARILSQARSEADHLVTERRQAIAQEIRDLEGVRDSVTADISTYERQADEQRAALKASLGRLQAVLDDPSVFRRLSAPDTTGATLADVAPAPGMAPATEVVESVDATEAEASELASIAIADGVDGAEGADGADGAEKLVEGEVASAGTSGPPPSVAAIFDQPPPVAGLFGTEPGPAPAPVPALDLTDESPLGPPDEEADAAMRAFFEAEFDDERRSH
jgi:DivIVA domain-containing protein